MAATHATAVAQASSSNAAGATKTGSWIDVTGADSALVLAKCTNGATGPTVACGVSIDLSPDNGTTVYPGCGGSATFQTGASVVSAVAIELPPSAMYFRTVFSGNTVQAVTVQADVTKMTAP